MHLAVQAFKMMDNKLSEFISFICSRIVVLVIDACIKKVII